MDGALGWLRTGWWVDCTSLGSVRGESRFPDWLRVRLC